MLINNKPDTYSFLVKRSYREHSFPVYIYATRILKPLMEKNIQTTKIINERLYFDFLGQKDANFNTIKKKIFSFFLASEDEINHYNIETIKLETETISILRVARDVDKTIKDSIPHFLKVKAEITEDPKFTTRNLARIN